MSRHALLAIVLFGALHSLLYVFVMPPWQHYDEPGHFEYVWLIANRGYLPKEGDYDQGMRRQVAASMVEHAFYRGMGFSPDLLAVDKPIDIGFSQFRHPPLYYMLAAVPLYVLRYSDITLQLYAARLVSLVLYLITLWAAWGMMGELVPSTHPLRWMVPAFLTLLPGFVDLMSAVNSDVGAVAFFSLFLWGSVRLVQRGLGVGNLLWVLGAAALCFATKDTAWIALPLVPVVILFAVLRDRWRPLAWGIAFAALLAGLVSIFSWDGAALWYVRNAPLGSERSLNTQAPLGPFAFELDLIPGRQAPEILQVLPEPDLQLLRGKLVTLGAWIWASEPVQVETPVLRLDNGLSSYSARVDATTEPAFHAFTIVLDQDAQRARVALAPLSQPGSKAVKVFYNGLVLAEGERPHHEAPQFDDAAGREGTWGGRPFQNLLRNASAESPGPGIRAWALAAAKRLPADPNLMLAALLDWQGAGWYWQAAARNMLQTFWARFGWGHVPLLWGDAPYSILGILTLLGILGAALALWRRSRTIPWSVALVLGVALVGIGGAVALRGADSLVGVVFIPVARYAFPAIIPMAALLNLGWWELARHLRLARFSTYLPPLLYWVFFIGLALLSLASILSYYNSPAPS